jgi:phosphatidylglycerophosphate synthase
MEVKKFKKLGCLVPTAISLGGYALVRSGIEDGITTRKGFAKVFTGRVFDLVDGFVARRFGWNTSFGKFADLVLDKKATQEIHDAVVAEGLVPSMYDNAIIAQEVTITASNGLAWGLHPERETGRSKEGAYAMAGKGLNMGGYALAEVVHEDHPDFSRAVRVASHVVGMVGIFHYGEQANRDYMLNIL